MNRVIYILLLISIVVVWLLGWLLPNHYAPWSAFYQDFAWFASVLLLASILLRKPPGFPLVCSAALVVAAIPIIQFFLGKVYYLGDGILAMLFISGFIFSLIAGYSLSISPGSRLQIAHFLASVLLLSSVLSTWIALRQWFLLTGSIWIADLPPAARPFANLAQPNNLATLLGMGLAAILYFYEKRQLSWFSCSALVTFLLFGMVLTQSRTPWVAAIAICVFWVWKSRSCNTRLRFPTLLLWVLIFGVLVMSLPAIAEFLLLSSSDPMQRMKSLQRWDLYKQFYCAVIHGPLWGYGWNQVSVAQVAITPLYPVALMTEYAHNIVLDLLIWNGPVLGGVIVVVAAIWLGRLAWVARSSEGLFALLAAGFVLTHSMLEYPHAYAYFLLPLGLLLGIAQADDRSTRTFTMPRGLLGALLLVAAGLGGTIWYEYRVIEEDFRLMRFETANIGNLKAEQSAPNVKLLTQLRELIRFTRTEAVENMSDEEIDWMRQVAHRYPYLPSLFRYSYALALNGRTDEAQAQLLTLRGLYGEEHYRDALSLLQSKQEAYPQLMLLVQRLGGSGIKTP
ncbi:Wzy polymerase domain-containing protein [Halopseudomonas aestusnigri]|uniref:PglL family O-oligosaccharyltransferase n=1 Tax=Halopseudomonas aestusnigri TaxID=857252 RepID=UPI001E4BB47C|nr:Wzy polymerase domain-containing protein [Halopseudomonas aestusnigri]UGV31443.1 Wzy polymerase domain-containing protein [Halopseudomonas aestusnigri]